ncbi:MAG: glutamate--tRNA ligase [Candidatus Sericytochromatia bacterium]|nr:glutamate--tRNA ligase [Candidatus Sericytochromatia bacterium]
MRVVTRFAPSPTGELHVGGARTALFNWLFARHHGGTFILRIEDTDAGRSTPENVAVIFQGMEWLGLDWDTEPQFQTARLALYDKRIETLIATGKAYRCDCTKDRLDAIRAAQTAASEPIRYDRHCRDLAVPADRPHVVRFICPDSGDCGFEDVVHGPIKFDAGVMDDFVLRRTDGLPTYNYAVVVDDHDMAISHVIRGDDHIANTPRQVLLYRAFGWETPIFGHIPMILGADKAKLSKRHGATSVMKYSEDGYLPEAMINFLARLGWSHGDQELFTRDELVQFFDFDHVQKTDAVFDVQKLQWMNGMYIRERLTADALVDRLLPLWTAAGCDVSGYDRPRLAKVVATMQQRANTLVDLARDSAFYFAADIRPTDEDRAKTYTPEALDHLGALLAALTPLTTWDHTGLEAAFRTLSEARAVKPGVIIGPARLAMTGRKNSPGMWEMAEAMGRKRTLDRLNAAITAERPA